MPRPLRVLLLEDSATTAEAMLRQLQQAGFAPTWQRVDTAASFVAALAEKPDIILANQASGYGAAQALQCMQGQGLDIPFLVIAEGTQEERAISLLRQGAADYVWQDRLARLGPAVACALENKRLRHEEQQSAQELRDREQWFRTLLDKSNDGICIVDGTGTVCYASPSVERILGYTATEFVGQKLSGKNDASGPSLFPVELPTFTGTPGESVMADYQCRHKNGSWCWLESLFTNWLTDPIIRGIVVNFRDVTQRKQTEESLVLFRTLIDRTQDAIEVVDPETGRFLDVNEKACRDHGYTREEFLALSVPNVEATLPNWAAHAEELGRVRQLGHLLFPGIHRRKDGTTFPVEVNLNFVRLHRDYLVAVVRDITDRKQAEARLRASEENFRRITTNMLDLIAQTDPHGILQYVTPSTLTTLGYQAEQMLGQSVFAFVHSEDQPRVLTLFQEGLRTGEPAQTELRYRHADGHYLWLDSVGKALRDEAGQVCGAIFASRDITWRVQAREELLQAKAFAEALIDSLPGVFCLFDQEGKLLRWNQTFAHVMGYDPHELAGMSAPDFVGEEAKELVRRKVAEVVTWGQGSLEADLVTKHGRRIPFYLTGKTFSQGPTPCLIGMGIDISERKWAEEALSINEAKLRCLSDAALDAVIMTTAKGMILHWNPAAQRMFGYSAAEALGQELHRLITPFRLQHQLEQEVVQFAQQGQPEGKVLELCAMHKNGAEFPVEVSVSAVQLAGQWCTVSILRDITKRKESEARIQFMALHDTLTGLPNRTVFQTSLPLAMAQADRDKTKLALHFLDLDHFKLVNDSLGHDVGDKLLRAVADRLRSLVRSTDIVARLGGDEFAIVQTNLTHTGGAITLAQKLLDILAQPLEIDGHQLHVTASIGITFYPSDGKTTDSLVKNADLAMYRAKNAGRNTYQFFSRSMNVANQERLTWEYDLREALAKGEFLLHYQPQMEDTLRRLTGLEALVRWQHPTRGLVSPGQFISIAEDSGLIQALGRWVLHTACKQAQAWHAAGLLPCRIAVNVSAVQFKHGDLVATVEEALQASQLPPHLLELEVTESLLMENVTMATTILQKLEALGIHVAIDDFGMGYSSLSYLKRFAVQKLKIDQSFVHDLLTDANDAIIVRAIIGLAHSLGLQVIAEGVETQAQLERLRAEACDEVQGYYLSRPLPVEEMTRFLQTHGPGTTRRKAAPAVALS
jgi:diguanylate cyclase (GGDEF)-like protein/PAS domain S-box-containing protein